LTVDALQAANPDVQDRGGQARVTAVAAGRLDAAAAGAAGATAEPATLGFGVVGPGSLPSKSLKITNTGTAAATFNIAVVARDQSSARVTVNPSSLQLIPQQSGTVTVQLEGTPPSPGSYEGAVTISGGNTNMRVPYLYLVGDGVAANIIPIAGGSFTSAVSDPVTWLLAFKLVDRYGVPIVNAPVQFKVVSGGGSITQGDAATDRLGIAGAFALVGSTPGDQVFTATAGGLTVEFDGVARPVPAIATNGVVNAASGTVGQGLAPGSYISIFGTALSDSAKALSTTSLPLSMAGVSVSFDGTGVSVPGRFSYVSDRQINVQIPWELQGQAWAKMKVSIGNAISSELYTVPLADFSHPRVQEEYVKPLMRSLFSDAPGCLNADGLKTDFMADKIHPVFPVYDRAWRGEERFIQCTLQLFYDEMKAHKPDAMMLGCTAHPFFIGCQDLIRTYDVPNSQRQHADRCTMLRHLNPGNLVSLDMSETRSLADIEEHLAMAYQENMLYECGRIAPDPNTGEFALGAEYRTLLKRKLGAWGNSACLTTAR
jgi:hypothetical protein